MKLLFAECFGAGRIPRRRRLASVACTGLTLWLAGCGGSGGGSTTVQPPDHPTGATPYTGQGWFVDADAGSDDAAGTSSAPWKTLARASSQVLHAGDAVLLKCGATWRESMTLGPANAAAGGATLGAWGDCSATTRPVVSGADPVSGIQWTPAAGFGASSAYVAPWPHPVSALYWNGRRLHPARYPNDGGIGHQFAGIASVHGAIALSGSTADAAALAGIDLVGARVVIRTEPWMAESRTIVQVGAGGVMTLDSATTHPLQAGQGYFVEGKPALLDAAGEWAYDAAAGRLYVWTPDGSDPTGSLLESVVRDTGVLVSGSAGNHVDRIAVVEQGRVGLQITDAVNTVVTAVSALDTGVDGIAIDGTTVNLSRGTSVQGSSVGRAGVNGISATGPAVQISGNAIDGTGLDGGDTGVSAGIYVESPGGVVSNNTISHSSYAAVLLSRAAGVVVSNNAIVQACQRFTDCGAIYSGGAPSVAQRTSVTSNAVSDMVPNTDGAVGASSDLVAGVYLDEDSATHDVVGNMISRVGVGINLHNSHDHAIRTNAVWLVAQSSIRVHSSSAVDKVRGNVIDGNKLYASQDLTGMVPDTVAPGVHTVYAQDWVHLSDATSMFIGVNPNIVRNNAVTSITASSANRWRLISNVQTFALDATQWGAYATGDTSVSPYSALPFLVVTGGPNLLQNGDFLLAGANWSLTSSSVAPGGTFALGTCGSNGCADFTPGSTADFIVSNTFTMGAASGANLYQLRVVAQAIGSDSSLSMAVNRVGGDLGQLGAVLQDQSIGSAQPTTLSTLFNATSSDPARLNMSGVPGKTVRLHDAIVSRVDGYALMSPYLESTLLTNETDASTTVDCPTLLLRTCTAEDLSGVAIVWPVTLAPHTAKAVLSADGKWQP